MKTTESGPEPAHVADLPGRSMLILYGSETGNSQDIAEELGRNAQRLHFKIRVDEMNGAQLSMLLQYTLVIFVISTTGQGDMPRNSVTFWKSLLRKKLPLGCLSAVKFTTFGFGDSMYIKFNWAARKLHKRLEQLGAVEFYPRGEADEQDSDGADEAYMPWAADLKKKLIELFPLPEGLLPIPDDALLPPRYSIALTHRRDIRDQSNTNGHADEHEAQADQYGTIRQDSGLSGKTTCVDSLPQEKESIKAVDNPPTAEENQPPASLLPIPGGQNASLEVNQRVTPASHFQDVRLIRLSLAQGAASPPTINPLDSLTIYPKNFPRDVQKLIDLMGWNAIADQPLALPSSPADLPRGLFVDSGSTTTLRDLLIHNLDITSIPRRSFLKEMSYFSDDPYHKERLLEFTMSQYTDEFYDYTTRPRRTILEVLEEFTSVKIPLGRVLDMFPVMRGRDFSIASVSRRNTNAEDLTNHSTAATTTTASSTTRSVDLLVALVKYKTVLRKIRQGLCSRYLESLPPGTTLRVTLNRSSASLHGSLNARRPLVAVATGTGVAPLRLFVEERLSHNASGTAVGDTAIFFGNRSRHADFHFKDVWDGVKARHTVAAAAAAAAAAADAAPSANSEEEEEAEGDDRDQHRRASATKSSFEVFTAFSRDSDTPREYVQDVIRRNPATIRSMAAADAIFVVCGGSLKMSRAVKEAVKACLAGDAETYPGEAAVEAAFSKLTWWEEIW